jgi:hypothetical protein
MLSFKAKLFAATLVAALGATSALANETGTFTGPFLQPASAARDAAFNIAAQKCAAFAGLQSAQVNSVIQNAGYYAYNITYTCNL